MASIRIIAFARAREIMEASECVLDLPTRADVQGLWDALQRHYPKLAALDAGIRFARNGKLASTDEPLADGDELALLPPVGGG